MAQCFIDVSAKGDSRLLVMAGYVAPAEKWVAFSKAWQSRLDDAKITYFKMHEWAGREEIAGFFYRAIEEAEITASISCVIRSDEMRQVVRAIKWPPNLIDDGRMENPYLFAFKAVTNLLIQRQTEVGITEPIDFIFDEESEKVYTIPGWDLIKLATPPDLRRLLGKTPSYEDDKKVLPLQAADLVAWWVRKRTLEGFDIFKHGYGFPWPIKRPIPGFHADLGEHEIRYELERMLEPENLAMGIRNANDPNPKSTFDRLINGPAPINMTIPDPSSFWKFGAPK